jgi:Domain of unknown function (DUF4149)
MRSFARFLLLLSLVVWIGSIVFFSFVLAPTVFSVLPAQEIAGAIVGRSLGALHRIGLVCGVVFLAATFLPTFRQVKALRLLVGLMLLCTALSQFRITPQMESIRAAVGGPIQALPPQDAGRATFDRLHRTSVMLEGVVLLAGIGAVALLSREPRD